MLHGAAPANGRAVSSTATCVEFGSVEELEWAGTSSRAVWARRERSQAAGTPSFSNQLRTPSTELTTPKELNERPPKNSRLRMVSWFIDLPQWGGALVKLTSLSALIGRGLHGSTLSGRCFGHTGKPAHSTRVDSSRKSCSIWRSRIGTATAKILSRKNEPPETTGGPWYVVASEPKAASTRVPWIAMEDGI